MGSLTFYCVFASVLLLWGPDCVRADVLRDLSAEQRQAPDEGHERCYDGLHERLQHQRGRVGHRQQHADAGEQTDVSEYRNTCWSSSPAFRLQANRF